MKFKVGDAVYLRGWQKHGNPRFHVADVSEAGEPIVVASDSTILNVCLPGEGYPYQTTTDDIVLASIINPQPEVLAPPGPALLAFQAEEISYQKKRDDNLREVFGYKNEEPTRETARHQGGSEIGDVSYFNRFIVVQISNKSHNVIHVFGQKIYPNQHIVVSEIVGHVTSEPVLAMLKKGLIDIKAMPFEEATLKIQPKNLCTEEDLKSPNYDAKSGDDFRDTLQDLLETFSRVAVPRVAVVIEPGALVGLEPIDLTVTLEDLFRGYDLSICTRRMDFGVQQAHMAFTLKAYKVYVATDATTGVNLDFMVVKDRHATAHGQRFQFEVPYEDPTPPQRRGRRGYTAWLRS